MLGARRFRRRRGILFLRGWLEDLDEEKGEWPRESRKGIRCRNESRSRIVVVVHPIMRLARHFRSRAANNPFFSTWEALIIVQKGAWEGGRHEREMEGWTVEWSMPFYFFQKLIEIARDHLPVDLFRAWTNQINQMEWSRNEFGIIILHGHEECSLLPPFVFVLLVTGPCWSKIESWNRFRPRPLCRASNSLGHPGHRCRRELLSVVCIYMYI